LLLLYVSHDISSGLGWFLAYRMHNLYHLYSGDRLTYHVGDILLIGLSLLSQVELLILCSEIMMRKLQLIHRMV
jgi:hypothetical protein